MIKDVLVLILSGFNSLVSMVASVIWLHRPNIVKPLDCVNLIIMYSGISFSFSSYWLLKNGMLGWNLPGVLLVRLFGAIQDVQLGDYMT